MLILASNDIAQESNVPEIDRLGIRQTGGSSQLVPNLYSTHPFISSFSQKITSFDYGSVGSCQILFKKLYTFDCVNI